VAPYFQVTQILLSLFLMVLILVQARGGGLTPSQDQSGIFRTRRGIERTLFNATLGIATLWVLVSIATVIVAEPGF